MSDLWGEEEDNNPYGSFTRRDSASSEDEQISSPSSRFKRSETPPSPSFPTQDTQTAPRQPQGASDEADDASATQRPPVERKKGEYDSRVEQLLYEHPELQISITHAGKNVEGGGSYIAYTIRTGDLEVRRRYRDFSSLRTTLVSLHPTLIIPPIPEKHSIADYAAKPTKAKEDEVVIEHRKRMLTSFLNRCRRMREVREDGVYWRFLDPNASWSEVLHSHPVTSLPKNNLKAPPLDPANPTPGHNWLPIPANNAKLKPQGQKDSKAEPSGTPSGSTPAAAWPSAAAHTTAGPQIFGRFPPPAAQLSEQELDPYFVNFESSSRELEILLQGNMEKVNRRTLSHLNSLAEDMSELGARLNGFSLSEQSATLAAAIEKLGQAVDSTYIATGDMSASLGASFSDPMRESAQFAGIVRTVLRYRILKRIQSEMARDELEKKKTLLNQLEQSEQEAQRIEEHLERSGFAQQEAPRRSKSARSSSERPQRQEEDTASIDSDFPSRAESQPPSASQGLPPKSEPSSPVHQKSPSGNFVTNKIFGRLNHAIHGIVDVDPERTRRDQIGKTKESLVQLQSAITVSEKDVKDASTGVLNSLQQFQREKEDDLRRYMTAYARVHIDWAKRNLASWEEAKAEVDKIDKRRRRTFVVILQPYLPFVLPFTAAQARSYFTTSSQQSNKRQKHTYARRSSSSSYDKQSDIFLDDEASSTKSLASPRTSPPPQTPGHAPTPRFIPRHLKEEVLPAGVTSRPGSYIGGSVNEPGMTGSDQSGERINSENDAGYPGRSSSPSVSFAGNALGQLGLGARASSPAKRSASELEDIDDDSPDYIPGRAQMPSNSSRKKLGSQHASPMVSRFKAVNGDGGQQDQMMMDNDRATSASHSNDSSDNTATSNQDTSSNSSPPTSHSGLSVEQGIANSAEHSKSKTLPSFDEQVQRIKQIIQDTPIEVGAKGYLVSARWILRVKARTSEGLVESHDKSLLEGEVGPVDNSDIADNDHFYGDLRLASGEPFVPLRIGTSMATDFEIIPPRAWDLILRWYGVAEGTHILARYAHKTSEDDAASENVQYELYPPICTIQKLLNDKAGPTFDLIKLQDASATNIVASRSDLFQAFLKRAKDAAVIEMSTKVRVWRILETGSTTMESSKLPTPVSSRGGSPAPQVRLPQTRPRLIVDLNAFTNLEEGSHRERIDTKDETANDKYNGHATLNTIGLPAQCTLILDEEIRDSDKETFVSDSISTTAKNLGVDLKSVKDGQTSTSGHLKPGSNTGNGRRSPTPSGMTIRGRTTKKGKPRGTTGLTNLGNTCYMNSALQCIRSVEELSIYFETKKHHEELNYDNPLGHNGQIAKSYETLIHNIYSPDSSGTFAPRSFKGTVGKCQPLFSGYGQQDSQEFLSFLVDGLHEDLNRIIKKPYMENPESDDKTVHDPAAVKQLGETYRRNHKARNDSVAMDLFNGFYKNTMICPVCNKISIIFDPYSLLTLQLPIENTLQHRFAYFPLQGRPFFINVDIDKNSTITMLKQWIGLRVNVPADRLICVEAYKEKLYQIFEDSGVISELNIGGGDELWVYELDEPPSNWPPLAPKKTKPSSYNQLSNWSNGEPIPDMKSPMANVMAVPLYHRRYRNRMVQFDLQPTMILITREEARDSDKILRKILRKVQTFTTRPLFDEKHMDGNSASTSDTEVVEDEDGSSNDESRPQARSVEGEDGLVDVSMREGADEKTGTDKTSASQKVKSKVLDPSFFVFPELRQLFDIKVAPHSGTAVIAASMNAVSETTRYETIESRVQSQPRPSSRRPSNASRRSRRSSNSSDELGRDETSIGDNHQATPPDSDEENTIVGLPHRRKPGQLKSVSKKRRQSDVDPQNEYLIRLGESLILDWSDEGWQQLFSGDGERGIRTDNDLDELSDPELAEKKARRAARRKNGVSLEECFEETVKTEVLSEDNAWYCGQCKERRRATKTLEIWTVPDILVVHLKRFGTGRFGRDKVDVLVDFPTEGLTLENKVGMPEGKSLTYDLFAVDNHYGGLGGGHYTAYAQNFVDKQWYEYNDQIVSAVKPESVVTRSAYLLFYRRRSDKPLGGPLLEEVVHDYYTSDSNTLSGEDSRPGDRYSNGSSDDSHEAVGGPAAGAAANHQGAQDLGSLHSYQQSLEQLAKNATRGVEGENDEPPSYSNEDEGFYESNGIMDSVEETEQFGKSFGAQSEETWNWNGIDSTHGTTAPPGSDDGSVMMNAHSVDGNGEVLQSRISRDFAGDSDNDLPWSDSLHHDQPVQHVSVHESAYDDEPVVEIPLGSGSDDETV